MDYKNLYVGLEDECTTNGKLLECIVNDFYEFSLQDLVNISICLRRASFTISQMRSYIIGLESDM